MARRLRRRAQEGRRRGQARRHRLLGERLVHLVQAPRQGGVRHRRLPQGCRREVRTPDGRLAEQEVASFPEGREREPEARGEVRREGLPDSRRAEPEGI